MTTIPELHDHLQALLTDTANQLAKSTGFIQRQRRLTGAGFVQSLVLGGLAQPEATAKQVHQHLSQTGVRMSVQGLDQRFDARAVALMQAMLEATLTCLVQSNATDVLLPQFTGVYLTDCTRLVWPDHAVKLGLRWELQQGRLHACLMPLHHNDQKAAVIEQPLPPGALHLSDLGFFKLTRFRRWSAQGTYWLTRYKIGTRLCQADGQPLDLVARLQTPTPIQMPVIVGTGRNAVDAWLVAAPLTVPALDKRVARLREQARLDQRPLSSGQLALIGWTLYLTNVPGLTFEQAHILARTRWQIELLFKLWKSQVGILRSRSAQPARWTCEGYGKLIGGMIAHWLLLVAGWQPTRVSALDALRLLRAWVNPLQRVLRRHGRGFASLIRALQADLALAAPLTKRRKHPSAAQLWALFAPPTLP